MTEQQVLESMWRRLGRIENRLNVLGDEVVAHFQTERHIMASLDEILTKVTAEGAAIDALKPLPPTDGLSPANQAKVDQIDATIVANDAKLAALAPPAPPATPPA